MFWAKPSEVGVLFLFLAASPLMFSQCQTFPSGLIPFSSVTYVTAPNFAGDQLVVGALQGGLNTISRLTLPESNEQQYCDSLQLAEGQFYVSVYVPTAQERSGNFSQFSGLLVDPVTNQPFAGGVIPPNRLGSLYAFRIAAAQVAQSIKTWTFTGPLQRERSGFASAVLPNGKVLVVGADDTAEIYDPATGRFSMTGRMRKQHGNDLSATSLNDGRVLVVGGRETPQFAELYNVATGTFTETGAPVMPHGFYHTSTLLRDGRVLVVGGWAGVASGSAPLPDAGAEIYDPRTGTFSPAGTMAVRRNSHAAAALQDGRVLIVGGGVNGFDPARPFSPSTNAAEIYDPATNTFRLINLLDSIFAPTATTLPNGKVLVTSDDDVPAELFDPATNSFSYTGTPNVARGRLSAVLLPNGSVLFAGGYTRKFPATTGTSELYNPSTGKFTLTGNLGTSRANSEAVLLNDGRVLLVGGTPVCCAITLNSAEIYTPTIQGLVPSQSGLTFRAAQGASAALTQSLSVLSPFDDIPWTVSVKTFSGGNWLSATPASSRSAPDTTPAPVLTVRVDPAGLAAQDYYGAVTLTPTDQKHPPVTIAVVFSIVPAGAPAQVQIAPGGLVFSAAAGASAPPQTVRLTNLTSTAVNFTAAASGTFFTFTPLTGTIASASSTALTVTAATNRIAAGTYRGNIRVTTSDGSTQFIDILAIVSAAAGTASGKQRAATCNPSRLLPVVTSFTSGAVVPVGWPAPILVQLADDCTNTIDTGTVTASFSNGDPPVSLVSTGAGAWSATWVPLRSSPSTTVRVDARVARPSITGTVERTVRAASNPNVPIVAAGGVLNSADFQSPPAAGLLVSIFGSSLADGSAGFTSTPLPKQIGSTRVSLGATELPVLFVSESQVNVLVPYETPLNTPLQLVVTRANAISVPVSIAVFDAQPAILSATGTGRGQGLIYRAIAGNQQILADRNSPARAGDVLVMYCLGLGPVNPPATTGDISPSEPLARVSAPVAVTIGGQNAEVLFAGLAPGYVGLYQVNVVMPGGVAAGNDVPVAVAAGGKSTIPGIMLSAQ